MAVASLWPAVLKVPQNLARKFLFRVQIGLPYPPSPCGPLSGATDLACAHTYS